MYLVMINFNFKFLCIKKWTTCLNNAHDEKLWKYNAVHSYRSDIFILEDSIYKGFINKYIYK